MGCCGSKAADHGHGADLYPVRVAGAGAGTPSRAQTQTSASEEAKHAAAVEIQKAAAARLKAEQDKDAAAAEIQKVALAFIEQQQKTAPDKEKKPAFEAPPLDIALVVSHQAINSAVNTLQESARALGDTARNVFGIMPRVDENTAPGLRNFYAASLDAGKLQRQEVEACLVGLGMRKGVLKLACTTMAELAPKSTDMVPLHAWWQTLNPRSRIGPPLPPTPMATHRSLSGFVQPTCHAHYIARSDRGEDEDDAWVFHVALLGLHGRDCRVHSLFQYEADVHGSGAARGADAPGGAHAEG